MACNYSKGPYKVTKGHSKKRVIIAKGDHAKSTTLIPNNFTVSVNVVIQFASKFNFLPDFCY